MEFEPIEFIAKLAALVPPPRAHLTRFHGIFAPNAKLRAQLTPSGRGTATPQAVIAGDEAQYAVVAGVLVALRLVVAELLELEDQVQRRLFKLGYA